MFQKASHITVTGSSFNNVGRDQALYHRASEDPHGPDIELGYHSRDTRFGFVFEPEELEIVISNINIPSDIDAQSDGTLTPVSRVTLDDVHPASPDEAFPTVPVPEHNTELLRNNVVLDSLNPRAPQTASAELTNPRPIYVLDRTIIATFIPSHSSDAIEDPNDEAKAREARLRQGRIETRTNNAVNWLRQTYGSNDGLNQYMNQFDASDIILRSCAELRELCDLTARLADPTDLGESDGLDALKLTLQDRIELDKSNFSMKPLTLMWFLTILVVLLSTFLLSALGSIQNADTGKPCTSVSHLTVAAIYIAVVFIMALGSKRWIVQREIAGAGPRSPAAANATYWSVLDLPQTKVGGGILTTLCFAAFGATWYGQCSRFQ